MSLYPYVTPMSDSAERAFAFCAEGVDWSPSYRVVGLCDQCAQIVDHSGELPTTLDRTGHVCSRCQCVRSSVLMGVPSVKRLRLPPEPRVPRPRPVWSRA